VQVDVADDADGVGMQGAVVGLVRHRNGELALPAC
jgi:hypothetical protein